MVNNPDGMSMIPMIPGPAIGNLNLPPAVIPPTLFLPPPNTNLPVLPYVTPPLGLPAPPPQPSLPVPNNKPLNILEHADIGDFNTVGRMTGGGHGQNNIDLLNKQNIPYNIIHTYKNGVRIGNVPSHKSKPKQTGTGQAWFPESWNSSKIRDAGNYVSALPHNQNQPYGKSIFGEYDGVRVGVFMDKNGNVSTIFPDNAKQPLPDGSGDENNPIQ